MIGKSLYGWAMFLFGMALPLMGADTPQGYTLQGNEEQENAQENNAQRNNKKPNILVIMGDDVGWFNMALIIGASCQVRRRTLIGSQVKACCLPTIMLKQAMPPRAVPTLSPANFRFAPASQL